MDAKPISISLPTIMNRQVEVRRKSEHMSKSEYVRHCIREEMRRAAEANPEIAQELKAVA